MPYDHWTSKAGITAPCHTARGPGGEEYLVPGCAARANDPDADCTCEDFEQAARRRILVLEAEIEKYKGLYQGLCEDYRKVLQQGRGRA
ncbi:hypothetical protein F7Q99_36770 [Streptomyces kaniharaensis]|uniref:Uncharacterized protein n=1 Tax=Streptomyces kaniharaensis TaxID=212423 RepID=A0A6N7L311_9ACTN|nr:hypothetical protein [Streptomyces kaniharaensis]MQS17595.1 hypothetical protein [Streptomyces kaniharaensis]